MVNRGAEERSDDSPGISASYLAPQRGAAADAWISAPVPYGTVGHAMLPCYKFMLIFN